MISDTHNDHRSLKVPDGDVLIHAGDFTSFGRKSHAEDFNKWLGELPHKTKIVVNGNHEQNAPWQHRIEEVLSNATILRDSMVTLSHRVEGEEASSSAVLEAAGAAAANVSTANKAEPIEIKVWGTAFQWPMSESQDISNTPYAAMVKAKPHIIVCHNPAFGRVDDKKGCRLLAKAVDSCESCKLFVCGHIHEAHGIFHDGERRYTHEVIPATTLTSQSRGTCFVNAANCKRGRKVGWSAVVVDLDVSDLR